MCSCVRGSCRAPLRHPVVFYEGLDALEHAEIEQEGHPVLHRGQAVFTLIEHEELHQETLAYMWHRLPMALKQRPAGATVLTDGPVPSPQRVEIPRRR